MSTLLRLALEFSCIGLFSVGGGMATVPFLMSISAHTGWFSLQELTSIIALSEATPGPIGVNMSTYVGYTVSGLPGGIVATLFLTLPSFLIILLLAHLIENLRGKPHFEAIFSAIRPASIGLIGAVLLRLCVSTFLSPVAPLDIAWKSVALFLVLSLAFFTPHLRKLPIPVFLICAALCGIVFQMATP